MCINGIEFGTFTLHHEYIGGTSDIIPEMMIDKIMILDILPSTLYFDFSYFFGIFVVLLHYFWSFGNKLLHMNMN